MNKNVITDYKTSPISVSNTLNMVLIHVCDEAKKTTQDFRCDRTLLLNNMKYFEKYLTDQKSLDDIDISVHCDITIFDWLMKYVHGNAPQLDIKNAISILISSDFLQMAGLVEESITYTSQHLQEILTLPIDMNCMNSQLVKRLANKVDIELLEGLYDKKDKLKSKIYMKKLELLFEQKENMLHRCVNCNSLFTMNQREWYKCEKAELFTDAHGVVQMQHVADKSFELNKFVVALRSKKIPWKDLYWKFFSCVLDFKCETCDSRFVGNRLN